MGFESGNDSTGTIYTYLIGGVDSNGKVRAIAVNPDGSLKISSTPTGDSATGRKIIFNKVFSDYTLTENDDFLAVDCSDGAVNITLPSATLEDVVYPIFSRIYEIKKVDNTPNIVTVTAINSETIDNASSITLENPHEAINLISDGYNWMIY
ncbi:MAG: hypothetical protein RMY28_009395 [Nostoc sp. ChiSLP01]|nr:hypothetical protein [Nostoc sp. CmiSLP01]MDZ8285231.1 hypothetical protein [Nostoc sp. ChiSLP01]